VRGGPLVEPEETGALKHFRGREGLCREIVTRVTFPVYQGKHPDDCPSEGEEPQPLEPPSPGIKGGGRSEESDGSVPRGPKIISHQVLTGPLVVIKRLEKATEEESERTVDVEMISDDSAPRCDSSSEEERGRTEPGPSKPRKRARVRPRKDGSGPFRPDSPIISQVVDMALGGEIPDLTLADLVPIADRSRVRQGDKRGYVIRSDDSDADDPTDPRAEKWWLRALDEIASGKASRIAAIGLEAVEKMDKARQRSRNVKGPVMHDLRVGAKIARQACLALCRHTSRFGAEQATADALTDAQGKVQTLEREVERLRREYQRAEDSRLYLLARCKAMENSENPSPVGDNALRGRGTKRSVHDRRGTPQPGAPRLSGDGPGPPECLGARGGDGRTGRGGRGS